VQKKYSEIGGGSPILQWTNKQGELLCKKLDEISPETAPHKYYVAFRYVDPLTDDTLERIHKYGCQKMCSVVRCNIMHKESLKPFFSVMGYNIPYFFLSTLNIVVRLQVLVLMLYIIITRQGDCFRLLSIFILDRDNRRLIQNNFIHVCHFSIYIFSY